MAKQAVAIVVDSTANLPPDVVAECGIYVMPQILNWEGETLRDGVDITAGEFYRRLATAQRMPTTSQPSAGEFHEFFSRVADDADSIVALTLSQKLSGTYASANAAKEMMGDYPLEIIDTGTAATALGFIALEAAETAAREAAQAGVAEAARRMIPYAHALFVVDTLEFLHRGGRIGGAQRLIGSMLAVKPVLRLINGAIEPAARVRTKRKAVAHMLDLVSQDASGNARFMAAAMHAAAPAEAQFIYERLESLSPQKLFLTELTPVIGAHVGPGTVGVAYYAGP
ncbi:MAG: DegV family protein [Candidatus Promineifilaceae bacterium]